MPDTTCSCCSGALYADCCQPYHQNKRYPLTALALMRSRYSAYAKGLSDYIIETTHPGNPYYQSNWKHWAKDLSKFSKQTLFQKLEIIEFIDGEAQAYVTFTAHLMQGHRDVSFIEKICFVKVKEQWMYLSGEVRPYASHGSREKQVPPSAERDPHP